MDWPAMRSRPFLAMLLNMVELAGDWRQGLLDAYIATIPKADGDVA